MSIPLREQELIPVDPKLAVVRMLSSLISTAITVIVVLSIYFGADIGLPWLLALVLAVIIGFELWWAFIIFRQVRALGYKVRDTDLLIERGIMFRSTTVVPYARMQYVDVTAGPIDRLFGLATVTLHTASAGTDAAVPGLKRKDADELREFLSQRGQTDLAGL